MNNLIENNILTNKISDLLHIPSIIDQLLQTVFVKSNKGVIELDSIKKENGEIKSFTSSIKYQLKSHRWILKKNKGYNIVISDLTCNQTIFKNKILSDCISKSVNQILTSEIKSLKNTERFTFKPSILSRIFKNRFRNKLLKKILEISGSNCGWIIMPLSIFNKIKNSSCFRQNDQNSSIIYKNVGKLLNKKIPINIYINSDESDNTLYFGNYNSITLIINENIKINNIKHDKGMSIKIDYIFIENDAIKLLNIC